MAGQTATMMPTVGFYREAGVLGDLMTPDVEKAFVTVIEGLGDTMGDVVGKSASGTATIFEFILVALIDKGVFTGSDVSSLLSQLAAYAGQEGVDRPADAAFVQAFVDRARRNLDEALQDP